MPKKQSPQLSLSIDDQTHSVPAGKETKTTKSSATAKPPRRKTKESPSSAQAYLPGLSRRGRPRSSNPVSPSARALESRKRRVAAGGRRVEFLLEPEAAAQLDALVEHFKISRAEVIARLIARAAKRLK